MGAAIVVAAAALSFTKFLGLLSALAGACGTALLYFGSFAYEQLSYWGSPRLTESVNRRNHHRRQLQRLGLGFLMLSFILGGTSVLTG